MKSKKHLKRKQRVKAELKRKRQEFKKQMKQDETMDIAIDDESEILPTKYWIGLACCYITKDEEQVYKVSKELFKQWDDYFWNEMRKNNLSEFTFIIYQDGEKLKYLRMTNSLIKMGEKAERILPKIIQSERAFLFRIRCNGLSADEKTGDFTQQTSFVKESIVGMLKVIIEVTKNRFYLTQYDFNDVFNSPVLLERANEFQKNQLSKDGFDADGWLEIVSPTGKEPKYQIVDPLSNWWRA